MAALFFAPAALAEPPTIAILVFANNTGDETFDALGRGLADMLVTDLSHAEGIQLVERARLQEILDEMQLGEGGYLDPKTAAKMGKGVGAKWVLTGSVSAMNPQMRLDARVVEVETSAVLTATETTGSQKEFFLLEKELATDILSNLEVTVTARESARIGRVATENFDAFMAYSEGLAAMDAGKLDEAAKKLDEALSHDDRFEAADTVLAALRTRLSKFEDKRAELMDEDAKRTIAALDDIIKRDARDEIPALMTALMPRQMSMSTGTRRAISKKLLDMELSEDVRVGVYPSAASVNEWATFDYVMASWQAGYRADVLTYGDAFLERYPASIWAQSVRTPVDQVLDLIAAEKRARGEKEKALDRAELEAHELHCNQSPSAQIKLEACRGYVQLAQSRGVLDDGDGDDWWRPAQHLGDDKELRRFVAWAKKEKRDEDVRDGESALTRLERNRKRLADTDVAAKLAQAEEGWDYVRMARLYEDVGRFEDAFAVLEKGHKAYPKDQKTWEESTSMAQDAGDLERLRLYMEQMQKNDLSLREAKEDLERLERTLRYMPRVDAHLIRERAMALSKLKLHAQTAEHWTQLADEYPSYPLCSRTCARQIAAVSWSQSMTPDQNVKAREQWQKILTDDPESDEARTAKAMIRTLPR